VLDIGHRVSFDAGECLFPIGLCRDWHQGSRLRCCSGRSYLPGISGVTAVDVEETATIRARVEAELKRGAEAVLKKIGLT
jgi:hypothetical protein